MITREQLEERKRQLEQAIKQLEANLIANQGALQMLETLLEEDLGEGSQAREEEGQENDEMLSA